jgi:hypothetical protein
LRLNSFDEALGQAEDGTKAALAARHLTGVRFVVVAGEVQEAVEDQDLNFRGKGVALFDGLAPCGSNADGEVAGDRMRNGAGGRKRQHIGRLVDAAKLAIEATDRCFRGEQDADLAPYTGGSLRFS